MAELHLLHSITNEQETSLGEPSCYTESASRNVHNACPNKSGSTKKSGGHCAPFLAMLRMLQSITDEQ